MRSTRVLIVAAVWMLFGAARGASAEGAVLRNEGPQEVLAWVSVPSPVSLGELLTLTVRIENARADMPVALGDVDIAQEFLRGFEYIDADPLPSELRFGDGALTLAYDLRIPAGRAEEIYIRLRAKTAGAYTGDVDLWEGSEFLTRTAQTLVLGD